jgi:Cu-Zn family superoxide dismutase
LSFCQGAPTEGAPTEGGGTFMARAGSSVTGAARFEQQADGVQVGVAVEGLAPGAYGVHIHEHGDCSAPDFSTAGGHFNPTNAPHACPPTEPRHAGDLGNIDVGADGSGLLTLTTGDISLDVGASSVKGLAIILHGLKDDCVTQPTGGSGQRIACAIIEVP